MFFSSSFSILLLHSSSFIIIKLFLAPLNQQRFKWHKTQATIAAKTRQKHTKEEPQDIKNASSSSNLASLAPTSHGKSRIPNIEHQ